MSDISRANLVPVQVNGDYDPWEDTWSFQGGVDPVRVGVWIDYATTARQLYGSVKEEAAAAAPVQDPRRQSTWDDFEAANRRINAAVRAGKKALARQPVSYPGDKLPLYDL